MHGYAAVFLYYDNTVTYRKVGIDGWLFQHPVIDAHMPLNSRSCVGYDANLRVTCSHLHSERTGIKACNVMIDAQLFTEPNLALCLSNPLSLVLVFKTETAYQLPHTDDRHMLVHLIWSHRYLYKMSQNAHCCAKFTLCCSTIECMHTSITINLCRFIQ